MAKIKQTVKVKKRVLKYGGDSGYVRCNLCGGSGRAPAPYSKKKKK